MKITPGGLDDSRAAVITGWTIDATAARVVAHVDAKVTAGTNTPEEKARFIPATIVFGGCLVWTKMSRPISQPRWRRCVPVRPWW